MQDLSAGVSAPLRTKMRRKYNLVEEPCNDWVLHILLWSMCNLPGGFHSIFYANWVHLHLRCIWAYVPQSYCLQYFTEAFFQCNHASQDSSTSVSSVFTVRFSGQLCIATVPAEEPRLDWLLSLCLSVQRSLHLYHFDELNLNMNWLQVARELQYQEAKSPSAHTEYTALNAPSAQTF